MTKENIKKTLSQSWKKSVFYQILRKKISILPNSKGEKSVYTDKISMSGRSEDLHGAQSVYPPWHQRQEDHSERAALDITWETHLMPITVHEIFSQLTMARKKSELMILSFMTLQGTFVWSEPRQCTLCCSLLPNRCSSWALSVVCCL